MKTLEDKRHRHEKGPFKRGKDYIYDAREICKMIMVQYNSQFDERNETMKATEEEKINNIVERDLVDIIISAVVFLINTRGYIKEPLGIILRKTLMMKCYQLSLS